MIPDMPIQGVIQAFQDFLRIPVIQWMLAILVGGAGGAFLVRLLISSLWR